MVKLFKLIIQTIFFIIGASAVIIAIATTNPMLLGSGIIIWMGLMFIEIMFLKEKIKVKIR